METTQKSQFINVDEKKRAHRSVADLVGIVSKPARLMRASGVDLGVGLAHPGKFLPMNLITN